MGKRSTAETFNEDLYAFPQLPGHRRRLAVPAKIMRHIWAALKKLDTIVPGVLHLSTIMYHPEIKMYANKPVFLDRHFRVSATSSWSATAPAPRAASPAPGRAASGRRRGYWAGTDSGRSCRADCGKYPEILFFLFPATRSAFLAHHRQVFSSGRCGNAGRKRR